MIKVQVQAGAIRELYLFATASRLALGPTQPPVQWILAAFSPGVKQLGYQANHSLLSSAEVKNAYSYTSTHPYMFLM
jgi:hypothetical protein